MTRRITDDELAREIMELLARADGALVSSGRIALRMGLPYVGPILRRLRALRDEGRVVEVQGPRGSLWRLP